MWYRIKIRIRLLTASKLEAADLRAALRRETRNFCYRRY